MHHSSMYYMWLRWSARSARCWHHLHHIIACFHCCFLQRDHLTVKWKEMTAEISSGWQPGGAVSASVEVCASNWISQFTQIFTFLRSQLCDKYILFRVPSLWHSMGHRARKFTTARKKRSRLRRRGATTCVKLFQLDTIKHKTQTADSLVSFRTICLFPTSIFMMSSHVPVLDGEWSNRLLPNLHAFPSFTTRGPLVPYFRPITCANPRLYCETTGSDVRSIYDGYARGLRGYRDTFERAWS